VIVLAGAMLLVLTFLQGEMAADIAAGSKRERGKRSKRRHGRHRRSAFALGRRSRLPPGLWHRVMGEPDRHAPKRGRETAAPAVAVSAAALEAADAAASRLERRLGHGAAPSDGSAAATASGATATAAAADGLWGATMREADPAPWADAAAEPHAARVTERKRRAKRRPPRRAASPEPMEDRRNATDKATAEAVGGGSSGSGSSGSGSGSSGSGSSGSGSGTGLVRPFIPNV